MTGEAEGYTGSGSLLHFLPGSYSLVELEEGEERMSSTSLGPIFFRASTSGDTPRQACLENIPHSPGGLPRGDEWGSPLGNAWGMSGEGRGSKAQAFTFNTKGHDFPLLAPTSQPYNKPLLFACLFSNAICSETQGWKT